jgi:hypothetical protein
MGHTRLGSIPKSRKWDAVVAAVAGSGGSDSAAGLAPGQIGTVADLALDAAEEGLTRAEKDAGLQYTFYLLTQLVLASRQPNWRDRLGRAGVQLPTDATTFDLAAAIQAAVDDHVGAKARPTDISEIAQQAAGEAVISLAAPRAATLFGGGEQELQAATRELSTKKGFARLGQRFFGRFVARFLNFYISRITADQVGSDAIQHVGDVSRFNEALRLHCEQSAKIVHDFCGQWFSKTEFKEGIDLDNTSRFMVVALRKLRDELRQQRVE